MHFLITNDDGYQSRGLDELIRAALARGHSVISVAPYAQCSAKSESITLRSPLLLHDFRHESGLDAYALEGTPADCTRVAPLLTDKKIDFCLSGINHGENVSTGVFYSGTVAAAREGAMLGLPAIAVSMAYGGTEEGLRAAARYAVMMAEINSSSVFPRYGVLNINVPKLPPEQWKAAVVCPLSHSYFTDSYTLRVSPLGQRYLWLCNTGDANGGNMQPHAPGTDAALLEAGHVTCTMISEFNDTENGAFALAETGA